MFQVAGGFCERMGAGTPFPCEDIETACRASHHGFTGALLPGLGVHHHHGRKRHSAAAEAALAAYDAGRGAYHASLLAQGVGQAWDYWGHSFLGPGKPRGRSELVQWSRELLGAARYASLLAGEPDPLAALDQERRSGTQGPAAAMTSPLTLHAGPGAGFDEPFEMLAACHQRVARMLDLLARLGAHLPAHGSDDAARQAARDVMRYFDLAGPAHHEDEERHVFPVLEALPDPAVRALVARLRHDHLAMAALWQAVRADLAGVEGGAWQADPASAARWDAFAALYRQHIAAEESLAYPAAQPLLDGPAQAAMGREMARRRGAR